MLILTGTYEQIDGTLIPMKFTLKDDRFSFWKYNYAGERVTVTKKLDCSNLDWDFYSRTDTSGETYHFWRAYTGEYGYFNYKWDCGNINFQTWDYHTVWVQVMYLSKGDRLECENLRITLDAKSIDVFKQFVADKM